jgi:hypothetical protein
MPSAPSNIGLPSPAAAARASAQMKATRAQVFKATQVATDLDCMIPRRNLYRVALTSTIALLVLGGCSHTPPREQVRVPPRLDLSRLGTLGLVDFASPGDEGLGARTAREFLAALQSAQPGTPVLELGDERRLLAELGRPALDSDALRALGAKYQVNALIVGNLESQRVSPKVAFDTSSAFASASAELEGALDVRILDTRTGATVWSTTTRARAEIAGVQISDRGLSSVGTSSPDDARQRLVTRLVHNATPDFWAHWE